MPSIPCPSCRTENAYPPDEVGRARICVKCGKAIPSQLTVPADAKPHVRASKAVPAQTKTDKPFRASFSDAVYAKSGFSQGIMLALVVGMIFAMLLGVFWYMSGGSSSGAPPAIVESPKPAARLTQVVCQRDDTGFVIYFTLKDDEAKEIARSGQIQMKINEISRIGIEGGGSFKTENQLYKNSFTISSKNFSWYDPGGFMVDFRRLVCAVKVPVKELSRQPQAGREGSVWLQFTDVQTQKPLTVSQKMFF